MPARSTFRPPDFCRLPLLFTSLVAAQLVVVVLALAPRRSDPWTLEEFVAASTWALWLMLLSILVLCKARPWLARLWTPLGAGLAWALPVGLSALAAYLVYLLDPVFGFHLEKSFPGGGGFAGRVSAVAAVLSAALMRYYYVQEQWLQNERAQARAAVDALQARIRPHFLFNSLNSILSLLRRDPVSAEWAIEDLSDLFRAALGAGQGTASLEEELSLCRRYLAIEQLRLTHRLKVEWQIDADVPMDMQLPRLTVQPLVENAVHHGISKLPEGGLLHIALSLKGKQLQVHIQNPLPDKREASTGSQHAVSNIEQRLAYHFADQAALRRYEESGSYHCVLLIPLVSESSGSR
ncbi:sensor histidine kinase [Pseudomarimonas arenosa]|uniref:Histidine kinase n=1 Tax=Pseudomarimonas arenosa TaxID=2774145 RepID=A0AAW3ZLB7_9GAMM|nr:histidine kinase [Pseudomarimonas arenosa]MBD8525472.1 histidine kinase [Pseudomarimonas arenosa]